jgi:hypothetical protein
MSLCLSVCLSARNNSAPTRRIFLKSDEYFSKLCREMSSLKKKKSDKNDGYFIWSSFYIYGNTRWFKYDQDYLCVNKSQFVPVIFEPPCI